MGTAIGPARADHREGTPVEVCGQLPGRKPSPGRIRVSGRPGRARECLFLHSAQFFAHTPFLRGAFAYLPARKVAIAVAVTFTPQAFTSPESPKNSADYLWREIAAALVPADAPPIPPGQQ